MSVELLGVGKAVGVPVPSVADPGIGAVGDRTANPGIAVVGERTADPGVAATVDRTADPDIAVVGERTADPGIVAVGAGGAVSPKVARLEGYAVTSDDGIGVEILGVGESVGVPVLAAADPGMIPFEVFTEVGEAVRNTGVASPPRELGDDDGNSLVIAVGTADPGNRTSLVGSEVMDAEAAFEGERVGDCDRNRTTSPPVESVVGG